MVSMGGYANPAAGKELTRLLSERRDMIGRHWFARVNPLDHFSVREGALGFTDLAVEGGLESADETSYRFQLLDGEGERVGGERVLASGDLETVGIDLIAVGASKELHRTVSVKGRPRSTRKLFLPLPEELERERFHGYEIRTRRGSGKWSKSTRVYFHRWEDGRQQLVRVEREE